MLINVQRSFLLGGWQWEPPSRRQAMLPASLVPSTHGTAACIPSSSSCPLR